MRRFIQAALLCGMCLGPVHAATFVAPCLYITSISSNLGRWLVGESITASVGVNVSSRVSVNYPAQCVWSGGPAVPQKIYIVPGNILLGEVPMGFLENSITGWELYGAGQFKLPALPVGTYSLTTTGTPDQSPSSNYFYVVSPTSTLPPTLLTAFQTFLLDDE